MRVFIALDRSGSMRGEKWSGAIDSINQYIESIKEIEKARVTIIAFDTTRAVQPPYNEYTRLVSLVDDELVSAYTPLKPEVLEPSGMTPLYDAAASVINMARDNRGEKVVVVILTDGHENTSKEYTQATIKDKVDALTRAGGEVIFLGANFDVSTYTEGSGLVKGKSMNYDLFNVDSRSIMASNLGASTVAYASMGTAMDLSE